MNDDTAKKPIDESESKDAIGQLIAHAGRRTAPSAAATQQVYRSVHDAWQVETSKSKWLRSAAIAATVLLVVTVVFWTWNSRTDANEGGTVAALHGNVYRVASSGRESLINVDEKLASGERLRSESGSTALLRRATGLTLLLGPASQVQWETTNEVRLLAGILYIDSGHSGTRDALTVLTNAGSVQHVGTQFSVDARAKQILIAVREGSVRVSTQKGETRLMQGEAAQIAATGDVHRQALAAAAGPWTWLAATNPEFVVDNRVLADVVRDIADASGVRVEFASPEIAAQAMQLVLHGPALKLEPLAALDAVLLTTQMRAIRDGDQVRIAVPN